MHSSVEKPGLDPKLGSPSDPQLENSDLPDVLVNNASS